MIYTFDGFDLDIESGVLRSDKSEISIEPKAYKLLCFLLENQHRMLSRDEIITHIWEGRAVSDAVLSTAVKSVRRALGDDGQKQQFLRTVHGRGFRFVADVQIQPSVEPLEPPKAVPRAAQKIPSKAGKNLTGGGLGQRPSVAVLPFRALGGEDQTAILAEALPHDLIQALSRLRWLLVIARGSTFRFRGPTSDLNQIGNVLGVRYLLFGTVELNGQSLIITVELSDKQSHAVIWSDRFVVKLDTLHELREQIISQVVSSLEVHIPLNEAQIASVNLSENMDAWSLYHLGLQHMYRFTKYDNAKAQDYFEQAIAQDTRFARAHAGLSFTSFQEAFLGHSDDATGAAERARKSAERSLELDAMDPFANLVMGRTYWLEGNVEQSLDWLGRTIALNPNTSQGHYLRSLGEIFLVPSKTSFENVDIALRLSPFDPLGYAMLACRALHYINAKDYETAAFWGEKGAQSPNAHFLITMIAVIAHALNGNHKKARYWAATTKHKRPDARKEHFLKAFPYRDAAVNEMMSKALKDYGL